MATWTRISLIAIATLFVVSATDTETHDHPKLQFAPVTAPSITYVDEVEPEEAAMIDWAIGRFIEAGLRLPHLAHRACPDDLRPPMR